MIAYKEVKFSFISLVENVKIVRATTLQELMMINMKEKLWKFKIN